jgi:hypothetical protein
MRLPWKRAPILAQTMPVSTKKLELEAAKQILLEVFHARPEDIEEMIQQRLDERSCSDGRRDGLWPATFCLGE